MSTFEIDPRHHGVELLAHLVSAPQAVSADFLAGRFLLRGLIGPSRLEAAEYFSPLALLPSTDNYRFGAPTALDIGTS
jgi:hypothetical protein